VRNPPVLDSCRAVFFDLFHTLISLAHSAPGFRETSDILGVDYPLWRDAVFHRSDDRLRGKIREPEAIIRSILENVGNTATDAMIREAAISRAERFATGLCAPLASTLKALDRLREAGMKLALVSNADCVEVSSWDDSPLSSRFDTAVFSCHCGYVKPEPEIYRTALSRLGLSPREVLFVGDGGNDEHTGAREVGMRTVFTAEFVKSFKPEAIPELEKKADYRIDSIEELFELRDHRP